MCNDNQIPDYLVEVWKEAIETQMHFNDLLIKMRTTVTSIILAVFGAAAFTLKEPQEWYVQILGTDIRLGTVVMVIGVVFLIVQFIIDAFYYFPLLLGAVDYTESLGERYNIPELSALTKSITKSVSHKKAWCILCLYYVIPIILGVATIIIIQWNLVHLIK
jgi:hypothetical protein